MCACVKGRIAGYCGAVAQPASAIARIAPTIVRIVPPECALPTRARRFFLLAAVRLSSQVELRQTSGGDLTLLGKRAGNWPGGVRRRDIAWRALER